MDAAEDPVLLVHIQSTKGSGKCPDDRPSRPKRDPGLREALQSFDATHAA